MPTLVNGGVSIRGGVTLNGGAGASVNAPISDSFLDDLYVHGLQNLTSSANGTAAFDSPTKYGSNPLGWGGSTWDKYPLIPSIIDDGSGTLIVYQEVADNQSPQHYWTTYSTTTDGITLTKPNLGLITYGGNTNNNIVFGQDIYVPGRPAYDASGASGQKYLLPQGNGGAANGIGAVIYGGNNGYALSSVKNLNGTYGQADAWEASALIKRVSDGHWLLYCQTHWTDLRSVGLLVSDTTDPTGAWTAYPDILAGVSYADQFYKVTVDYQDGLYLMWIWRFDALGTSRIPTISLFASRDGRIFYLKSRNWLTASNTSTDWDYGMIWSYCPLLKFGNDWRFYYGGTKNLHNAAAYTSGDVGFATIGYQRLGKVSGTGTLITVPIVTSAGPYTLTVNANGTGGSVKVHVTDTNGNVLSGYTYADMDTTITTDSYGSTVTWGGGNPVPANSTFRLGFQLTSGYLYHYTLQ